MPRQLNTRSEYNSERHRGPSTTRFPCGLALHPDLLFGQGLLRSSQSAAELREGRKGA